MGSPLRRAALSVHLNIAEGSSRKSVVARKRYYEISRGSIIEIDSVMDFIIELGYLSFNELKRLGECIVQSFKLVTGMIQKQAN